MGKEIGSSPESNTKLYDVFVVVYDDMIDCVRCAMREIIFSPDEPYVIMEHYMDNTLDTVLAQLDNFIQTTNVLGANENFNTQWEGLTNNSVKKLMKRG